MKLKVFFVSESHSLKDGGGFYAAENAQQARQLFIQNESFQSMRSWTGTTQEMIDSYCEGQPRKIRLKFT